MKKILKEVLKIFFTKVTISCYVIVGLSKIKFKFSKV